MQGIAVGFPLAETRITMGQSWSSDNLTNNPIRVFVAASIDFQPFDSSHPQDQSDDDPAQQQQQ